MQIKKMCGIFLIIRQGTLKQDISNVWYRNYIQEVYKNILHEFYNMFYLYFIHDRTAVEVNIYPWKVIIYTWLINSWQMTYLRWWLMLE